MPGRRATGFLPIRVPRVGLRGNSEHLWAPSWEDDNYIYLVRYYKLRDFLFPDVSRDASEGEIWLYDPDLEKVGEWDIAGLECLIHEEADGLEASAEGIQHALLVPVPIALMDEGGTYRFVAHIEDDHAGDYREHRNRWALDLNSVHKVLPIEYFGAAGYDVVWCKGEFMNQIVKRTVRPWDPYGHAYAARDHSKDTGANTIRAAVNGTFFWPYTGEAKVIGEMGSDWTTGTPCTVQRWCFGMQETGRVFGVARMPKVRGVDQWIVHRRIRRTYNYGFSNVGLLMSYGQARSWPDSNWHKIDPGINRPRTAIGWTHHSGAAINGDFFLVTTPSAKWSDVGAFFLGTLPSVMQSKFRRSIQISTAIMLDGGDSTQLSYCRKGPGGTILKEYHYARSERHVLPLLTVEASCKP